MYPISDEAKALFEAEQRQMLRITGTDKNGASIRITEADVLSKGFSIDRASCNGERLEIGTAIAAEMTLKLDNRDGRFKGVAFEGAELFVEIGVADWTLENPTVHWIPCGYFTSYEQPRSLSAITLHALDRMMRFDDVALPPDSQPWTNEDGVTFPATVSTLVEEICKGCGMSLATDISALPNADYVLNGLPDLQQTVTLRNLIQWCAGLMGTNAWVDWNGDLRFSWYDNATGYISTTSNRFSSDLYENALTITGVSFTDTDEGRTVYLAGKEDYALDVSGNFFLTSENAGIVLTSIYNVVHDYVYTPFSATVINAPWLYPMDRIVFTDRDGVGHVSLLTNVNFTLNGNTALAAKGETAQANGRTSPGGFTASQTMELRRTQRVNSDALSGAVERATAQITGASGGYVRFIYDANGKLAEILIMDTEDIATATRVWRWNSGGLGYSKNGYSGPYTLAMTQDGAIVADFITTGELSADRISGGTLTLGGKDNANGTLQILDANGNVIGVWNNSGVELKKGSIKFPMSNSNSTEDYVAINEKSVYPLFSRYTSSNNVYETSIYRFGYNVKSTITNNSASMNDNGCVIHTYDETNATLQLSNHLYNNFVSLFALGSDSNLYAILVEADSRYVFWVMRDGSMRVSNANVANFVSVGGNLTVSGTKSRQVSTDQYSDRLLYCYETPSPLFGDVGEGDIGEDGRCWVWFDPVFAQTISTEQYQVFLQRYGPGDCWVAERRGSCFIVEGAPGLKFGWEVKAKQADFDQRRLDRAEEPFKIPEQNFGAEAAQYISKLKKERIEAV